jgi:hypothetical protein
VAPVLVAAVKIETPQAADQTAAARPVSGNLSLHARVGPHEDEFDGFDEFDG